MSEKGFTLIELSIVLVVIGLIIGGVLVGQDLVRSAETRGTISQIEKYNTAVNTFYGKYGALPGDMNALVANQFGFSPRGSYCGEGDGDGIIQGMWANAAASCSGTSPNGEEGLFWVDLTTANGLNINMIDGGFSTASATSYVTVTGTKLDLYMPQAKLGRGNYIYVWGGASSNGNYFGILAITAMNSICSGCYESTPSIPVRQAYDIDSKIDDGLPQYGRVQAFYIDHHGAGGSNGAWSNSAFSASMTPYTTATPASGSTCFDNGGSAGAKQQYSLSYNNGTNTTCTLSIRFQ